jgi:Icc-related predicted phosphoesterase
MALVEPLTDVPPSTWLAASEAHGKDVGGSGRLLKSKGARASGLEPERRRERSGQAAMIGRTMTSIVCIADLHEHLVDVPRCDLLLIAGDVSFAFKGDLPAKQAFLIGQFNNWLEHVPATEVVLVAGNHDQSIEAYGMPDGLRCHYLEDGGVELFGLRIWGTPWQPWFSDWAFNAPRRDGESFLATKFDAIPVDTNIVVAHGPPRGYGDRTRDEHVGSTAMTATLERVQPRLMVCGHIHPGYGRYQLGDTEIVNAALVDDQYRPVNPLVSLEL